MDSKAKREIFVNTSVVQFSQYSDETLWENPLATIVNSFSLDCFGGETRLRSVRVEREYFYGWSKLVITPRDSVCRRT